jgi:hypothetical protein
MTNIIRILIVVGLVVLVFLLVQKMASKDENPAPTQKEDVLVDLSEAELEALLKEAIAAKWDAIVSKDWLKVYELMPPDYRAKNPLVKFMQGRDSFYFENWQLLDYSIEGFTAKVRIQHDWGVHLDIEIDLGDTHKEGAVRDEEYFFDPKDGKWYTNAGTSGIR